MLSWQARFIANKIKEGWSYEEAEEFLEEMKADAEIEDEPEEDEDERDD